MTEASIRHHGIESILNRLEKHPNSTVAIEVEVLADFTHTNLRGNPADQSFVQASEAILQHSLEIEANTFVTIEDRRMYWLGPDERLILAPIDQNNEVFEQLTNTLQASSCAVNDVSGGQLVLRLTGSRVAELLSKGCNIDLHSNVFFSGTCVQTSLAKASVLVAKVVDNAFELIVRRSFSEYLVKWLAHAGRDAGIHFD